MHELLFSILPTVGSANRRENIWTGLEENLSFELTERHFHSEKIKKEHAERAEKRSNQIANIDDLNGDFRLVRKNTTTQSNLDLETSWKREQKNESF